MLKEYAYVTTVLMTQPALIRRLCDLGLDVRAGSDIRNVSHDAIENALENFVWDMFEVEFVKPVSLRNSSIDHLTSPIFNVYVRLSNDVTKLDINRFKLTNPKGYKYFSECFARR